MGVDRQSRARMNAQVLPGKDELPAIAYRFSENRGKIRPIDVQQGPQQIVPRAGEEVVVVAQVLLGHPPFARMILSVEPGQPVQTVDELNLGESSRFEHLRGLPPGDETRRSVSIAGAETWTRVAPRRPVIASVTVTCQSPAGSFKAVATVSRAPLWAEKERVSPAMSPRGPATSSVSGKLPGTGRPAGLTISTASSSGWPAVSPGDCGVTRREATGASTKANNLPCAGLKVQIDFFTQPRGPSACFAAEHVVAHNLRAQPGQDTGSPRHLAVGPHDRVADLPGRVGELLDRHVQRLGQAAVNAERALAPALVESHSTSR